MTKAERQARRDRCKKYLREAGPRGGLPAAMEAAAKDGFSQNTSVWLGALGEVLLESHDRAQAGGRRVEAK